MSGPRPKLFLLVFLLPIISLGQHVVQGRVVDSRSLEPLAFVHVLADGMREGATTDIDGRYNLSVDRPEVLLRFSYVGYAPLEEIVTAGDHKVITMHRTAVELRMVEVLPGENPAHRIIKQVYAGRKVNNGLRNRSHRYTSYSKTIFTAAVDSALLNDPDRLAQLDTSDQKAIDWMEKHHLLMIESATKRSFIPPAAEKEEVLAMRVSGLKDPSLLAMAASTKTFSVYEPQIVLNERTYLSPIGPGSTERYMFLLEDTLYQGPDSVFVISYRPRIGRKFDGLQGVLYVNTDGYALQNVIAEPVERQNGFSLKLQQQFEKIDGRAWFPVQLNTFLFMDFVEVNNWRLMGVGRTWLKDIEVDADVQRKEVRGPELVAEHIAMRKDDELWATLRNDPLDERELRTYHVIDSIGEEFKLDQKLKWLGILSTGRLPIGFVDLRLNRLLSYNGHEGIRPGIGLSTNDKISRYFALGGYVAYGFQDKQWKQGADLVIKPRPGRDIEAVFSWQEDVAESGGVQFHRQRPLLSTEHARMWFVDRMDNMERTAAEVAFRVDRSLKLWIGTERRELYNSLGYRYAEKLSNDIVFSRSGSSAGAITAGVRFAFREQVVRLPDREITIPSRYPVVYANVFRALPGLWQGQEDLWRVNVMVEKTFRLRMLGDLSMRAMAGMAQTDAHYHYLFNPRGTLVEEARISIPNTFETMLPNEFLADRYVALHVRHSFGNLLFKGRKWRPVPVLIGNAFWGGLEWPELHNGYTFIPPGQGFYEAGIQLDDLFSLQWTGFGVGAYMRLGSHRFEDTFENIAVKLTLTLGR